MKGKEESISLKGQPQTQKASSARRKARAASLMGVGHWENGACEHSFLPRTRTGAGRCSLEIEEETLLSHGTQVSWDKYHKWKRPETGASLKKG